MRQSEFAKILEIKMRSLENVHQNMSSEVDSNNSLFKFHQLQNTLRQFQFENPTLSYLLKKSKTTSYTHNAEDTPKFQETIQEHEDPTPDTQPEPTSPALHIKEVDGTTYLAWTQLRSLGMSPFRMDSLTHLEAKKAYRSLAIQLHPDTGQNTSTERFMLLKTAYQILEDSFLKK